MSGRIHQQAHVHGCPRGGRYDARGPCEGRGCHSAHLPGQGWWRLGPGFDLVDANAGGSDAEKCIAIGAIECAWTHDGRAASIFTQSKDYDEISNENCATAVWSWRDQSVPDADELDDGFAVKYMDGTGAQHLYFGADRAAVNGSKDAGFWFFHDDASPTICRSGARTATSPATIPRRIPA